MPSGPGRWPVVLVGCFCAGFLGCKDTVVEVVAVSEVAVVPSSVSLSLGSTQQLTASPRGTGGHALGGRTVSWSSSNTGVATVSQAGLVTGTGAGTATITATSEGKSGSATVTVPTFGLTVTKTGTGSGTVTSSPTGINCGTLCSANYASGTVVTLTASAASGSVFAGWGGACTGTAPTCQVTMSQARSVTATFSPVMYTLTLTKAGTGSGTVTSSPAGINCGTACEADFAHGTVVTLTASAAAESAFSGWAGACIGTGATCQVLMNAARYVVATFALPGATLGVGLGPEQFALIPAGSFQMGDLLGTGWSNELPVHTVNITKAFYMQKTEVTQTQWREVMGSSHHSFSDCGDTCPLGSVSLSEVQSFLTALNNVDPGKNYRLPTEAEWEYAVRAGSTEDYGGTGVLEEMGWYRDNSSVNEVRQAHPVAQKLPNHWGLYDMHGNVWEWVNDWYSDTYYSVSPTDDPLGPATGTWRQLRGGSWYLWGDAARSAARGRFLVTGGVSSRDFGFRLVRTQ